MLPDKVIQQLLVAFMGLPENQVVLYNQGFDVPKDDNLYIIIATGNSVTVGVKHDFIESTNEEKISTSKYTTLNIDIASHSRVALERKDEINMSLGSALGQNAANENNMKFFRTNTDNDLSAVEGAASLHRRRIPIIISHVVTKTASVAIYDKFRNPGGIYG